MGKTLGYGEITVANMTEPFTVMLTNEAQQFATDSNRKVTSAQSYYTDIIVIRGSQERTDYTIGNITSGSGITVSKNSKRVTFSVSAGTTIGADAGVIEIPITLDGQTVKKQFSWSCGKQGPQGVQGNDGNSFAWNMLSETNCGKKHWGTESSGGKYSVEDFITEDNIDAVKLICTEAISTSNWSYVSFKDIKMLKQLKPSTKYTLSYDIKANRSGAISHSICKGDVSNFCTNTVVVNNIIGNETWQHISVVLTTNDLKTTPTNEILYLGRNALSKVGYSIIKNLKLVEGDIDTPWSPSQSDIEGKGVVETVQYYLATSQASGVTSSTSGWSTDITTQKLTADKKYLWNCYQTKYSDGTSEPISTPNVIGVYGDKGTSTKIIRTSYKYTQNKIDTFSASGYSRTWGTADATTGLKVGDNVLLRVKNTTKGSDCLIFTSITAIPSNYSLTCTSYGLIDNGADGQDGEDGAGFHWNLLKYSGDLSKQVLGGAGTYTATVESIEDKTTPSGQAEKITYTVQGTGGKFIQTGKYIKEGDIKQGKTYTVSVWCKCSSIKSTGVINAEFLDNKTYVNPTLSTEWQHYVVTGVANKDVTSTSSASAISFYYNDNMSVGDIFYISSPKVEEGDKPSPWCTTYEETLAKNLSITPSSQYFKSTDGGKTFAPNTITIKPTIQGEISFGKWQYSIDGGVSFADVVSGQKGLTISNNVLTVSKDSSLYSDDVTMVTFRAVANDSSFYDTCSIAKIYDVSDIGDGRNLLWNSNFAKTDEAITGTTNSWGLHTRGTNLVASIDTSTKHNGFNTLKTVSAANGDKNSSNDLEWFAWGISERTSDNLHSKNQNYTLSFYAKASVTTDFIVRWGYDAYGADTTRTLTTNWQKYEIKLHQATSAYSITIIFKLLTAGTVWLSEFKLEKGSSATGYSTAPEDLQTAILSTKSEISDVSLKVDKNKQAIEQRVEKTTYQQDLNLVKGDISKANEGLNKWRYEIYPKSLFASEYQGKSTMGVFAKNTNLTPSQSVLINDTDFGKSWAYGDNYIGYALTFVKFSAAKSIAITFKHDDGAHLYLNGKLIGGDDTCNIGSGESLTLSFIQGWNCLEVVLNEKSGGEYIGLGTTISAISECQLMNCYYGTPVARQSHITNQLVENTTNIEGVTTTMQKVMTTVGGSDKIDEFVNNYNKTVENEKQFKKTIGETYTTKDEFNGLEIGGRNLLLGTKDFSSGTYKSTNNFAFSNPINGFTVLKAKLPDGQQYYDPFSQSITYEPNTKYTLSFYAKADSTCGIGSFFYNIGNDGKYVDGCTVTTLTTSWKRYSITWATGNVSRTANILPMRLQGTGNTWCYMYGLKFEKGSKATDWTPAPEDNEINGQNLVSNLPANWEQGTFQDSKTNVGCDYNTNKASMTTRIRVKELVPVSGTITISNAYSNQSKKPIQNMITAFDVNKKWLGNSYVSTDWNDFPRIVDMKDAKYIAVVVRYKDESAITPSDISQICLKIERGTSATPFTLAPEDVNGKIVNVETIANQTAKKFEWIVKGGDSSSNFTLTDRVADLVAERINFKGLVTFSGLNTDAKNEIGKVAQSKVDGLEVGGRNLLRNSGKFLLSGATTGADHSTGTWRFAGSSTMTKSHVEISDPPKSCQGVTGAFQAVGSHPTTSPDGECIGMDGFPYFDEEIGSDVVFSGWARVVGGGDNCYFGFSSYMITFSDGKLLNNYNCIKLNTDGSWTRIVIHGKTTKKVDNIYCGFLTGTESVTVQACGLKLEKGNKATDWTPAPEDVSQDATNKASQALTDAKNYSSNAVKWVTSNGSSTTSLNSMVKKWTDGAVSDTTQVNGGWIKANTITASKIAIGDFTNYCDMNKWNTYGFTTEDTEDGVWFSKNGAELGRDNHISEYHECEPGQQFRVEYDLSNTIKEGDTYKDAGIMLFGYDGTKTIKCYQRNASVTATADGTTTHISSMVSMPSGIRFFRVVLQIEGHVPFTGTLKIRNISVRKATTGKLIVDGSITADKIATDAIKSRNYISSGCTQGSFLNLSDGSFKSPNLSWDSNGNLIAKNANLSGQITATKGSIGKYEITDQWLITGSGSTATGIGGNQAFWAGAEDSNSAPFRVGYDGKFVSSNADISGKITATEGKIGKYEITDTYLKTGSGSTCSGIGSDDCAFWAGGTNSKDSNFVVLYGGSVLVNNLECNDRNSNDALAITNGTLYIQSDNNSAFLSSTGFEFEWGGDYRILSVGDGVKCYRNLYATDFIADGWIYNAPGGHYTWKDRNDAYISCGNYNNTNNVYYYAGYHAFYVNGDSGSGMMYIETSGVSSRKGFRNSSDERIKQNFSHFDDNFIDTYMSLEPVQYQFKNDTDDKYHFGFKAQQTERILNAYGQESDKSYGICATHAIDSEKAEKLYGVKDMHEEYTLAYDELIAPTTYMVQHTYKELESTKDELTKVKQEKADLEARLQAIEAKLGL